MPFYAFFSLRLSTFWEGFISSQRIEVSAPLSLIGKSAPRDYILFFRPYFKDNSKQTMQMEIDGNNDLIYFFTPFPLIKSKALISKFNISLIFDLNLSSFWGGVTDCEYLRHCNFC